MNIDRDQKVNEIISFVNEHRESTASLAISRRLLGYVPEINDSTVNSLEQKLSQCDEDTIDSCYYIVM